MPADGSTIINAYAFIAIHQYDKLTITVHLYIHQKQVGFVGNLFLNQLSYTLFDIHYPPFFTQQYQQFLNPELPINLIDKIKEGTNAPSFLIQMQIYEKYLCIQVQLLLKNQIDMAKIAGFFSPRNKIGNTVACVELIAAQEIGFTRYKGRIGCKYYRTIF